MKYVIALSYCWLITLAGWLTQSMLGDVMILLGIIIMSSIAYRVNYGRLYVKGYRVI